MSSAYIAWSSVHYKGAVKKPEKHTRAIMSAQSGANKRGRFVQVLQYATGSCHSHAFWVRMLLLDALPHSRLYRVTSAAHPKRISSGHILLPLCWEPSFLLILPLAKN